MGRYKKLISIMLIVLLSSTTALIGGCSKTDVDDTVSVKDDSLYMIKNDSKYFDLEPGISDDLMSYYEQGVESDVFQLKSPLYVPDGKYIGLKDTSYLDEKRKLIEDIMSSSNDIAIVSDEIISFIDEYGSIVIEAMDTASKLDESFAAYNETVIKDYAELMAQIADDKVLTETFQGNLENSTGDEFENAWINYSIVQSNAELGIDILNMYGRLIADSGLIDSIYGDGSQSKMSIYINTINELNNQAVELDDEVARLIDDVNMINSGISAIYDAEYYFGLSVYSMMIAQTNEITSIINESEKNYTYDPETISLIKDANSFFGDFSTNAFNILKNDPRYASFKQELLVNNEDTQKSKFISIVYADGETSMTESSRYMEKGIDTLKAPAQAPKKESGGLFSSIWSGVKNGYNATRKKVAEGFERFDNAVQNTMDTIVFKYEGLDNKLLEQQKKENDAETELRIKTGNIGQAMDDSYTMLDDMEQASGKLIKKVVGDNLAGKVLGGAADFISSIGTGFGKSVLKVLNPKTPPKEIVTNSIGIGLTILPGLDFVGKATKSIASKVTSFASGTINALSKTATTVISKVAPAAKNLMSTVTKKLGVEKITKVISNTASAVKSSFNSALSKGKEMFSKIFSNSKAEKVVKSFETNLNTKNSLTQQIFQEDSTSLLTNFVSPLIYQESVDTVFEYINTKPDIQKKVTEKKPLAENEINDLNNYLMTDMGMSEEIDWSIDFSDIDSAISDMGLDEISESIDEASDALDELASSNTNSDSTAIDTTETVPEGENSTVANDTSNTTNTDNINEEVTDNTDDNNSSTNDENTEAVVEESSSTDTTNSDTNVTEESAEGSYSEITFKGYITSIYAGEESMPLTKDQSDVVLELHSDGTVTGVLNLKGEMFDGGDYNTISASEYSFDGKSLTLKYIDDEGLLTTVKGTVNGETMTGRIIANQGDMAIILEFRATQTK